MKRKVARSSDRAVIDALAQYAALNDMSSDVFFKLGHRNASVHSNIVSSSSKADVVSIGILM